jgi:oxygen-independent coproporphyrinogen-3 oxidase
VSSLILEEARATQIEMARALGFTSVATRIACGRRAQDAELLPGELRSMLDAGVARVNLHSCACTLADVGPRCREPQAPVGPPGDRGAVRARAIATLQELGMRHVGLGLFARADDPLVLAREHGRLHLEVDGLAAGAAAGTLALGAGAFGRIGAACYRNAGGAREHAEAVSLHGLSVAAGCVLSAAAQARRSAVASLVCHGRVDFEALALAHLVEPRRCFAGELRDLAPLVRAGLVDVDADGIELTPQGEHLVDVVIGVFEPDR